MNKQIRIPLPTSACGWLDMGGWELSQTHEGREASVGLSLAGVESLDL